MSDANKHSRWSGSFDTTVRGPTGGGTAVAPLRPLLAIAMSTAMIVLSTACRTDTAALRTAVDGACEPDPTLSWPSPADYATVERAQNFSVEYADGVKRVEVKDPLSGRAHRYWLVPCGQVPDQVPADTVVFEIPPRTVVTTSTTEVAHLAELGVADRLAGHDDLDNISSAPVRERIASGEIAEIGDRAQIDLEALLALAPDLVFAGVSSDEGQWQRLEVGGLRSARNASFLEASGPARAEWLKFTALFFNLEAMAQRRFDETTDNYDRLVALARNVETRPRVLFSAPFRGVWHVPGGRSFAARLLADAGGDYLFSDNSLDRQPALRPGGSLGSRSSCRLLAPALRLEQSRRRHRSRSPLRGARRGEERPHLQQRPAAQRAGRERLLGARQPTAGPGARRPDSHLAPRAAARARARFHRQLP